MAKSVSEKNTKTEILEAYNEILAKAKEQKAVDQRAIRKETEEREVVRSAAQNTVDDIVKKLAGLKLEIVKSIDGLEEKLIAENKRFAELQQAVTLQSAALDEMYGIQPEAGSLSALIVAQRERKEMYEAEMGQKRADFEEEMAQKRLQWKREQEDAESARKERDSQSKKDRQREEEEYTYNLNLQRKKEADDYEARKSLQEKELRETQSRAEKDLAERETRLASREQELEQLRLRVESFPGELEKTAKETEKSVTERIEFKYKYQADLAAKEIEGEKKLNKQMISALERKISEQEEQIRQLTQKADDSMQQVQTIAVKAIEGASTQRIFAERVKDNT